MLLKEYPEEYVQNNARNWLKIQQDIAFVKKSLKGSGPPRREIVKSLLERKKSAENDKRLGLKSLPELDAASNSSTAENFSQTRVRLESYGVTFPDRRNFTSSTSFCLSPNTAEKEEEKLGWLNSCLLVPYHLIMAITLNKLRKWPIFCCPSSPKE